ncbi:MAG: LysR family transcriptional regulator [Rhizobiaceae bacterium]
MKRLPPLRLLVTFEAIARLGAMREAAAELNVTQPAITQAMKTLEEHVGVRLLDRSRRPARLTAAGQQLARVTRDGLDLISRTIEEIRSDANDEEHQLTVSCTLGIATYWLMPRLPDFYSRHPDILVNVQAPLLDVPTISAGVDLALRYGTGGWNDGKTIKLFDEVVCPVGCPAMIEALLTEGIGLDRAQLIHVRSLDSSHWASWSDYLKLAEVQRIAGAEQYFANYIQAVQAALDGRGLILGWRSITGDFVEEGALIPWPDGNIDLGTGYYMTLSSAGVAKKSTEAFFKWLGEQSD